MRIALLLPLLALISCTSTTGPSERPSLKVAEGSAGPTDWRCTGPGPTFAHVTSDEKGALIQAGYTCVKNF